jgi:hypothetical protein
MGRKLTVLTGTILGVLLMVASAPGQWSAGGADQSSLLETPSGGFEQNQPPVYYPYWHNYLDNMQRQGGYYSVTGNYAGSAPVTSYYPANPSSDATSAQTTQSTMYYNPSEYQAVQGSQPYAASPIQQPAYQTPAGTMPQQVGTTQPQQTSSKKKRRLKAKQEVAEQGYYQQTPQYQQQQPSSYQQSPYQSQDPYAQQQAYQQQAYQQQGYQQQGYPQQPGQYPGQYAGYQQQPPAMQSPPTADQSGLNQDPVVRDAQQKAYERAVARQRAAELASQQQAAVQELQQAQQMLETAQNKFRDQETRQKQLQEEYQKKAIAEAYETLRGAQQRYYDLMGVSGESGRPGTARQGYPVQAQARGPQQMQYPQTAPVQGQSYPQSALPAQYPSQQMAQQPQYQYGAGQAPVGMPAGQPFSPSPPPGQATPLMVQQQQQQEEGGGFWSTLKEIFLPPTTSPNARPMDTKKGAEAFGG